MGGEGQIALGMAAQDEPPPPYKPVHPRRATEPSFSEGKARLGKEEMALRERHGYVGAYIFWSFGLD